MTQSPELAGPPPVLHGQTTQRRLLQGLGVREECLGRRAHDGIILRPVATYTGPDYLILSAQSPPFPQV